VGGAFQPREPRLKREPRNAVSILDMTVSDPPTQMEVQNIANRLDQLILALRR
jgi:hypothetical protein